MLDIRCIELIKNAQPAKEENKPIKPLVYALGVLAYAA